MKTFFSFLKNLVLFMVKVCLLILFLFTKVGEEVLKAINTALSEYIQPKN